jgi:prophage maintenance system killer protein
VSDWGLDDGGWAEEEYFAARTPWIVTRDGQVHFGDKGGLHDDLKADAMIDDDDEVAQGEIVGGTARQFKPLGDDYKEMVEEAYVDQGHYAAVTGGDDGWKEAHAGPDREEVGQGEGEGHCKEAQGPDEPAEGPVEYAWPEWADIDHVSREAVPEHMGYRDTGAIEGAVGNVRMKHQFGSYRDIYDLAADLFYKVQRQQGVVEGNKRTAVALALSFLEQHGIETDLLARDERTLDAFEAAIDDAALSEERVPALAAFLRGHCSGRVASDLMSESMDQWYGPGQSSHMEGVDAPGEAPGLESRDHWVYLDGVVDGGGPHWDVAEELARKLNYPEDAAKQLGNLVARGMLPPDADVAIGTVVERRGKRYPQVWLSTVDRNAVWDAVAGYLDGPGKSPARRPLSARQWAALSQEVLAWAPGSLAPDGAREWQRTASDDDWALDAWWSGGNPGIEGTDSDYYGLGLHHSYERVPFVVTRAGEVHFGEAGEHHMDMSWPDEEGYVMRYHDPREFFKAMRSIGMVDDDGNVQLYTGSEPSDKAMVENYIRNMSASGQGREDWHFGAYRPDVPPEPGTEQIPPGYVRLFHYTGADADTIRREGLRIRHARGETYGEPNRVWASARFPEGAAEGKNVVEFAVPVDDSRWDIGRRDPWRSPEEWAKGLYDRGSHVTFHDDIGSGEIISVHEPWHRHYRYMEANDLDPADYEWLFENHDLPHERRAMKEWAAARRSRIAAPIVNHEFTPFDDREFRGWDRLNAKERQKWKWRAIRMNSRADKRGAEGRIAPRQLWAIFQRHGGRCAYCDRPLEFHKPRDSGPHSGSFDHVVALSLGGSGDPSNIVPACQGCNHELARWDASLNPGMYQPTYHIPEDYQAEPLEAA